MHAVAIRTSAAGCTAEAFACESEIDDVATLLDGEVAPAVAIGVIAANGEMATITTLADRMPLAIYAQSAVELAVAAEGGIDISRYAIYDNALGLWHQPGDHIEVEPSAGRFELRLADSGIASPEGSKVYVSVNRCEVTAVAEAGIAAMQAFSLDGRAISQARCDGTGQQTIALPPGPAILRITLGEGTQASYKLLIK